MLYVNSSREVSDRVVDIIRFAVTEKKQSFYAYCHLKNQFREFSFKGVQRLFRGDEEIANPQQFLLGLYKQQSGAINLSEIERPLDVIKAIWFYACADGVYKRLEQAAVKKYARLVLPDIDKLLGKDFVVNLRVTAEEMTAIASRAQDSMWSDDLLQLYATALDELTDLKTDRYREQLRECAVFDFSA